MKLFTNILIWIFAVLLTGTVLIYQRMTGPTYPKAGSVEIAGEEIDFALLRSWANEKLEQDRKGARISIEVGNPETEGVIRYKRLGTDDEWTYLDMLRGEGEIFAYLPVQPKAGKLLYNVELRNGTESIDVLEEEVVIRYKGWIPAWIPLPHVLLIFLALLFSTMAAVEALRKGKHVMPYTILTIISMLIGGLIMGPFMQKYAFDAWWTGWPWGKDMTDSKTMFAFIIWVIAFFVLRRNPKNRFWPVFAAIITLAVFVIPHSIFGSEFDHTAGKVVTGK